MNSQCFRAACLAFGICFVVPLVAFSQTQNSAADAKTVPVIDGGIGPCTADFTVTDSNNAPVFDAKIRVHIAYRFGGFHKLDLEVGTNADGKARFTGLPDNIKHGLVFHASKDDLAAEAFDDPTQTCKKDFTLVLQKKAQ
ncbi:MAG TPA: hypothetical protein VFO39_20855 [Candidatus Sulfotelmatobacter sp.]|nr:hypothetical protein [Candidatus Sulfotelmatobacter sp.]